MNNKLDFIFQVSDSLEFLEDGINAARILSAGRNDSVNCTMSEEEYKNAQTWIFDHISDDLQTLRATVSKEIGIQRKEG